MLTFRLVNYSRPQRRLTGIVALSSLLWIVPSASAGSEPAMASAPAPAAQGPVTPGLDVQQVKDFRAKLGVNEGRKVGSAQESQPAVTVPLPDDGPRAMPSAPEAPASAFAEAVSLAHRGHKTDAAKAFRAFLTQAPDSPLIPATRLWLADLLAEGGDFRQGIAAVETYRTFLQQDTASPDAARAIWRIGDLFAGIGMGVEAEGAYEQARTQGLADADTERATLGLANLRLVERKFAEAEAIVAALLAHPHGEAVDRYGRAIVALSRHHQGRFAEAQALFDEILQRWPDTVRLHAPTLLAAARNAKEAGRVGAAIQLFATYYNLFPKDDQAGDALITVGDLYRDLGEPKKAALFFAEAMNRCVGQTAEETGRMRLAELALDGHTEPPAAESYEVPGWVAVRQAAEVTPAPIADVAERRKALRAVAEAHARDVLGSEALFHLGEQEEQAKNRSGAIAAYRQTIERRGQVADDPWPGSAGGRLRRLVEPDVRAALDREDDLAAVEQFQALWVSDDFIYADAVTVRDVAGAHARLGFTAEAIRLYHGLLQMKASAAVREETLFRLGVTYLDQEDFKAARQTFDRYRVQFPVGPWRAEAFRLTAVAHRKEGNALAAVRVYQRWLQFFPQHPDVPAIRLQMADAMIDAGQPAEAMTVFAELERAGLLHRPAALRGLIHYADLLAEAGRHDEAVTRYLIALRGGPDAAQAEWVRLQLARVLRTQAHGDGASRVLKTLETDAADEIVGRVAASMRHDLRTTGKAGGS